MNHIVLGLDRNGRHESAERLLARLNLPGATVDAFYAIEPPAYLAGFTADVTMLATEAMADALVAEEKEMRARADDILVRFSAAGMTAGKVEVDYGAAAPRLMEHADRSGANLIAVGSSDKKSGQALFVGSVGRGLVIGARQSVLIAKGAAAPTGPVRAVFATDHSGYANRCLKLLKHIAPRGLSRLTVVTCYEHGSLEPARPFLPEYLDDPDAWVRRGLDDCNQHALRELEPLGCALDARIVDARPNAGIARAMQETGAELLIVGAQGHGFVERLTLGSTSLHQAIAEPHPVLVLRLPVGGLEAEA